MKKRAAKRKEQDVNLATAFFSLTIFLSAGLMFAMQPMIGKMMLPLVGGTPSGWLVAMAFFQIALLAGYAAAYLLSRFAPVQHMVIVCAALALGLVMLPYRLDNPAADWTPRVDSVFFLLLVNVSLPFLALSMVSSSLQRLFGAMAGIPNPYILFAASNFGSFCGLLAYPLWVETHLGLLAQAKWWEAGYILLLVLCGVCVAWSRQRTVAPSRARVAKTPAITSQQRLRWVFLAFIPASAMVGLTSYITVEGGSLPLFWVVPLAAYLLTFVVAFSHRALIERDVIALIQPFVVGIGVAAFIVHPFAFGASKQMLPAMLFIFVTTALLCHVTLAEERPASARLTEYYLWVALGGALGGSFNVFVAPFILPLPVEFLLVVLLSCFVYPEFPLRFFRITRLHVCFAILLATAGTLFWSLQGPNNMYHSDLQRVIGGLPVEFVWAAAVLPAWYIVVRSELYGRLWFVLRWLIMGGCAAAFALAFFAGLVKLDFTIVAAVIAVTREMKLLLIAGFLGMLLSLFVLACWKPRVFACVAPLLGLMAFFIQNGPLLVDVHRDFFGVWRVFDYPFGTKVARILTHGATTHGVEQISPVIDVVPRSYYDPNGPLGDIFSLVQPHDVALVGLGAGTVVCYEKPGRHFTVYEIDPAVIDISSNYFDYFTRCGRPDIVVGDARRSLAAEAGPLHDLIVVDAFTADMIPLHLMTREAFEIFFKRLKPDGVLAIHISNRYYDLRQPASNLAQALGLSSKFVTGGIPLIDKKKPNLGHSQFSSMSSWIALARDPATLSPLTAEGWNDLPPPTGDAWTDDFSSVLPALNLSSLW